MPATQPGGGVSLVRVEHSTDSILPNVTEDIFPSGLRYNAFKRFSSALCNSCKRLFSKGAPCHVRAYFLVLTHDMLPICQGSSQNNARNKYLRCRHTKECIIPVYDLPRYTTQHPLHIIVIARRNKPASCRSISIFATLPSSVRNTPLCPVYQKYFQKIFHTTKQVYFSTIWCCFATLCCICVAHTHAAKYSVGMQCANVVVHLHANVPWIMAQEPCAPPQSTLY